MVSLRQPVYGYNYWCLTIAFLVLKLNDKLSTMILKIVDLIRPKSIMPVWAANMQIECLCVASICCPTSLTSSSVDILQVHWR